MAHEYENEQAWIDAAAQYITDRLDPKDPNKHGELAMNTAKELAAAMPDMHGEFKDWPGPEEAAADELSEWGDDGDDGEDEAE